MSRRLNYTWHTWRRGNFNKETVVSLASMSALFKLFQFDTLAVVGQENLKAKNWPGLESRNKNAGFTLSMQFDENNIHPGSSHPNFNGAKLTLVLMMV